jgi:hypothetical protein
MTFHQFITNFPRRCTSRIDTKSDEQLSNDKYYIYLHTKSNMINH